MAGLGVGTLQGPGHSLCSSPQPAVDFFSGDLMIHPVTNRPADKRSFIPSLVEKEKVGALLQVRPHCLPCPALP